MTERRTVFITGATGYIGRALCPALIERGHVVRALTRGDSWKTLPPGVVSVHGDALDGSTYRDKIAPADTFVHLVGTPHPGPGKAHEFRDVDLASIEAAVAAATHAGVRHFIYLSVAQPAPIMRAYVAVRQRGEALVQASAMRATMVRPWYVLGPGRSWPLLIAPLYGIMERLRPTREFARRLGLVTITEMTNTLLKAVEDAPQKLRVFNVPDIRVAGSAP
jgi:uncharacterized protein YbjT (DUF2867 family)